jgi:hypothetical protein
MDNKEAEGRSLSVDLTLSAAISALVLVLGVALGHLSIVFITTACAVIICAVGLGATLAGRILSRQGGRGPGNPELIETRLAAIAAELSHLSRTLPSYLITDEQYSHLESSKVTIKVIICKSEMGLEFDPNPRRRPKLPYDRVVRSNIAKGVRYQWISHYTEINKIRADIIRRMFPSDQISVVLLNDKEWHELPFSLETVFITSTFNGVERVDAYLQIPVDDVEAERYWIKVDPDRRDEWRGRVARYIDEPPSATA